MALPQEKLEDAKKNFTKHIFLWKTGSFQNASGQFFALTLLKIESWVKDDVASKLKMVASHFSFLNGGLFLFINTKKNQNQASELRKYL